MGAILLGRLIVITLTASGGGGGDDGDSGPRNTAPVAEAGPNQNVIVGALITLESFCNNSKKN